MIDSGFESGVEVNTETDRTRRMSTSSSEVAMDRKDSYSSEASADKFRDSRVSADLKSLCAMEEYVNNLAEEGNLMEGNDRMSESKIRSLSVTEFMKSSGQSPISGSIKSRSSFEGDNRSLHKSDSETSITVIPDSLGKSVLICPLFIFYQ